MLRMQSGAGQLKDWMIRRRFLQKEAAEYLGIDETFVSQLVNGRRVPGLENAVHLERMTGIPVEAWMSTERGNTDDTVGLDAAKSRHDKA